MRLNVVLLPEPLGPIRPRISPSASSKETLLTAVKPPKFLVSPETLSTALLPTQPNGSARVGVALGKRQGRVGRLDGRRPHDLRVAVDVLHHHGRRPLVLAGHQRAGRKEFHAI